MKLINLVFITFMVLLANSCSISQHKKTDTDMKDLMIRISEIEIDFQSLEEYKAILKEEAKASVLLEPGVISIYPMFQKDNPTQVRILEIYANREAYKSHLETPHFLKYKTTTLKMVKSLRLVDMEAIDTDTMREIFSKLIKDKN
ncbi:putative quinol monooxygenase [Aquipluma nitroreducens]|nr:antibiotic biosynthesis monooxygenase [Aquipluma nitroreducens]